MIIAVIGQKGGIGKSDLAISLSMMALQEGYSVLLGDGDPQRTALTWQDVALKKGLSAPTTIVVDANMRHPNQLPRLAKNFEVVIIDCPPRLDDVQDAAMSIADLALLPCPPSDAWALTESVKRVKKAQIHHPSLLGAVAITLKMPRTSVGKRFRQELNACGLSILQTEITYRVSHQEARLNGQTVLTYTPKDQNAATEIRSLFDEIVTFIEKERNHGEETAPPP